MKIAITISGFLRTWEHTKKSFIEQILSTPNEFRIFLHIYRENLYECTANMQDYVYTNEEIEKQFAELNRTNSKVQAIKIENRKETLPFLEKFCEKYKHVSNYHLLQQESSDNKSVSIPIGMRTIDQHRKLYECDLLRKQDNTQFDLVMKTRFDIVYYNKPNFEICLDNKVHFGHGATWGWPDDTLCICTPKIMDLYASRFLLLDEMFPPNCQMRICAHEMVDYVLKKYNIQIGEKVVNINCFRSRNSLQFYEDYRKKCEIEWLYNTLSSMNLNDVYKIEERKKELLFTPATIVDVLTST